MADTASEAPNTARSFGKTNRPGSFAFYEAEGDTCAKVGEWAKAVDAYTQALNLKEKSVKILLARSGCYIHLGMPDLALQDADKVLEQNSTDHRAEALFAAGDFEYALMFYHRGNHIKSNDDFRLGIQKAEQAISDSIAQESLKRGSGKTPALSETVRSSYSRGAPSPFSSVEMLKGAPPPDRKQTRKLLGEMFADRKYLEELANDPSLSGTSVHEIATGGLKYLDTRTEFWRQQNPPSLEPKSSARSRPSTRATRQGATPRDELTVPRQTGGGSRPNTTPATGAPQSKQRALSRQKYLEQTRYAIQTLENVNAAIDYGDPELGLKFAKGFLSRLATLEIPDKPRILGNLYSCMGITYMELGKLTLAAIHHRKDLDIAVKYNYKDAYLRALGNLGQVYQRMGDFSQAIAMYEKKLMFGDESEAPRLCESIGRCYLDAGDFDNAIRFAERAIKHAQGLGDAAQQMAAYLLHGQALSLGGNHADSVVSFERTLDLARELQDIAAQANALTHLGNAYLQMGEVPRSIELQQQALELSAQLNQPSNSAPGSPAVDERSPRPQTVQ